MRVRVWGGDGGEIWMDGGGGGGPSVKQFATEIGDYWMVCRY